MNLDDGILHQIFHEIQSEYEVDCLFEISYMQDGVQIDWLMMERNVLMDTLLHLIRMDEVLLLLKLFLLWEQEQDQQIQLKCDMYLQVGS
ncbi:hypothetical protein IKO50_04865 [bacterium]|nr:hypothetical protein [bacterium]